MEENLERLGVSREDDKLGDAAVEGLGGGCAAGIVLGGAVPVLLTSRADPPSARLASIALAAVAKD